MDQFEKLSDGTAQNSMSCVIDQVFSVTEVEQLERGLVRLDEWSTSMFISFPARRLRRLETLWVNRRWFLHVAQQIAFGQVHRLYNGGYFSSNLTGTASLLDYGGMRALPNWSNARTLDSICGFGEEMLILRKVVQSLAFYFRKYGGSVSDCFSEASLIALAKQAYQETFDLECLRLFGIESLASTAAAAGLIAALRRYWQIQQQHRVNYKHGPVARGSWLFDNLKDESISFAPKGCNPLEVVTLDTIFAVVRKLTETKLLPASWIPAAWSCAVRYLMPREDLDRESLQKAVTRITPPQGIAIQQRRSAVHTFIESVVTNGRRHWRNLPPGLVVKAQTCHDGSSALECHDVRTQTEVMWCEGILSSGLPVLFGQRVAADVYEKYCPHPDQGTWHGLLRSGPLRLEPAVPSMQFRYPLAGDCPTRFTIAAR